MFKRAILMAVVLALPGLIHGDNICDDMHALANDWHGVATYIHEVGADSISPAEWKEAKPRIDALDKDTEKVIALCAKIGNAEEKKMGKQLESAYKALDSANERNVVAKIDALVAILDRIVASCDKH